MASPSGTPNAPPVPSQQSSPPPPFDHSVLLRHVNPSSNPNANPNPTAPLPTSIPFYGGGTAVPSGPYSYPPATPPFNIRPFMPPHAGPDSSSVPRPIISYPLPSPNTSPSNPNPNPGPNPGIRLMQLLGNNSPSHIESAASMSPTQNPSPIPSPTSSVPILSQLLPAMPSSAPPTGPARMPSTKMPRGRHLGDGEVTVHDVDSRLPGEVQAPQLEVTPITKYTSDPGLVLGRQIAVNRSYIVYGLKMGNIRILNIHTALRSLLRGHTQRVTDMAFFAEDVHYLASASVDGRIYVWKIDEGPDVKETPQIAGKIITALQIVGETRSYHPRICWHSHKQEILYVGIANRVLKIDTTKVGRGKDFNAEEPLICPLDKLIDGVYLVGKHDDDVTDLSISQWMMTRLASASKDGTVKIWDDKNKSPITWINAHDGQPVNSVAFLASPETPSHVNLVTSGPLNREIKIWSTVSEEGWLLPSESEKWQCTQTLDLKSSSEPNHEEAFFNQVAVLPQASLIILANAKKNAIYAIHVDYNSCPISTRMDYVADFTVTMPILSLTGSCESLPNGEQVVQVYCVQTMAIQQYALELSLCMPPPVHDGTLIRESSVPVLETVSSKSDTNNTGRELNSEAANETRPSVPPPLVYTESNASAQSFDGTKSPQSNIERGQSSSERDIEQAKDEISLVENTRLAFSPTHLITPNMISGSSPVDPNHTEEVKVNQVAESETAKEPQVVSHETKEQPNIETVNETKEESQTLDEGGVAESASRYEALKGASELVEENKEREKAKAEESSFRVFNSTGSNAANNSTDAEQNFAIYDMLQQIMNAQKEIPKQVNMLLAKEGKRIETSLGRSMEKSIKANAEALWARHLEDNAKREKTEKERLIQPLSNSIMSSLMKELPALHERALRKELTNLGPVLARAVTPAIEKHISSVIPEAIQKAVSEKVVNQLEKSVSSKLDGTVARQIQAQFQTSGRQALQETLRSSVESSMVPAFERSCKAMFDQVDASFHKGMAEHTSAVQQQYDASQTPLALTLRDTINSASLMTQNFTSELLDVPRKVLAIVAQGNTKPPSTVATQSVNGLVPGLPEIVEAPVDPTKELTRLITDRKYEEAFTMALQRSDVSIVSWLCTQVDLRAICSMAPLPLNQGVLLALLQQLACDIVNDTSRKVVWMTDVAVAINPTDPMIAMHVRPICEQVYNILVHHRSLPTTSSSDGASIKLVIHVINSVLMSCK